MLRHSISSVAHVSCELLPQRDCVTATEVGVTLPRYTKSAMLYCELHSTVARRVHDEVQTRSMPWLGNFDDWPIDDGVLYIWRLLEKDFKFVPHTC